MVTSARSSLMITSIPFLFLFLPATVLMFILVQKFHLKVPPLFILFAASLFFYAWMDRKHFALFIGSMTMNFCIGRRLQRFCLNQTSPWRSNILLASGIGINLGVLGYFKYSGFISSLVHWPLTFNSIPGGIPLGISFYSFTQLMYLIDSHAGLIDSPYTFMNYGFFVSFFPYAVAGPLVKHEEIIGQVKNGIKPPDSAAVMTGSTLLAIGLCKKILLADNIARLATPLFVSSNSHSAFPIFAAWSAAVAYAFQLYFDFSGYSDMAAGLGQLFGIRIPYNFDSPFKARNIVDFWKRWHITLTRFLTNYVYNPLVLHLTRRWIASGRTGLRAGTETVGAFLLLTAAPTLITMLVSGIWHGAGWQFIWFGLLHGLYLTVYHAYRILLRHRVPIPILETRVARGLTFVAVVISFIFFRADSARDAFHIVRAMAGFSREAGLWGIPPLQALSWLAVLSFIIWFLPNSQEWCQIYSEKSEIPKVPVPTVI
jgi:alginate O-acetyltransferase complex protein AlgI